MCIAIGLQPSDRSTCIRRTVSKRRRQQWWPCIAAAAAHLRAPQPLISRPTVASDSSQKTFCIILYHPAKVPGVAGALHAPVAHAGHVPQALGQVPQSFSTTVIRLMYSLSAQHSCQSNWQHPGRPAGQSRLARVAHGVIRVLRILILAFSAPSTHPIWWLLLLITMRVQRVRLLLRNTCMARPSSEATSCWPARP